jgi:HlyD family secretion protein/adhesin transport system membrane fusion protein
MSGTASTTRLGGLRQLRHLSQPVILEEIGPPHLVRVLLLFLTLTIFAFIGWTAVTSLKETTKSSGEVVPTGSVLAVQHLEGGIISQIFVRDGDLVEKGAPLVKFAPTAVLAQLEEFQAKRAASEIRRERLHAFGQGRLPNFDSIDPRHSRLVAEEQAIYEQQHDSLDKERQVLLSQHNQRISELEVLHRQKSKLQLRVKNLSKQKVMHETLVKTGLVSRLVYLQTLEQYDSAAGDLNEVRGKITRAEGAIEEAVGKIAKLEAERRNDALNEAGRASGDIAAINETIVRAQDRVTRLTVVAPVRGIIKGLATHTIGGVVAPGGLITEIVPADKELVVEARISPIDIGHVSVGQKAAVKITTYDFSRFGAVDGEVTKISATTFKDRENEIYYKAQIKLAKNYVGDTPGQNLVLPGMVTEIDVITGERTLLRYLLRPIFQSLDTAFSER